jgi:predicted RNA-binding protein with RPS1 domain/DNA-binding MarR family transcriptional regulator
MALSEGRRQSLANLRLRNPLHRSILKELSNGALIPKVLASRLHDTESNVTKALKKLRAADLVDPPEPDELDGRLRHYHLSLRGQSVLGSVSLRGKITKKAIARMTLQVNPRHFAALIGQGGKVVREIMAMTGVAIEVKDDGTVLLASSEGDAVKAAIDMINGLDNEPEVGEFYLGVVKRLAEFGAFVEILPGTDGLVHISELDSKRVSAVEDICQEGDEMLVKVIGIDRATGKIRLSRRETLGKKPEEVYNVRAVASSS